MLNGLAPDSARGFAELNARPAIGSLAEFVEWDAFRAATGWPLTYVVGTMWDGGNVAHYAPERPRVLIDGDPRRAPWIDLGDLRSKGAVVVWTSGDPAVMPVGLRGVAGDAQVQPPFTLPFRRGDGAVTVGWAILRPQPAFAMRPF